MIDTLTNQTRLFITGVFIILLIFSISDFCSAQAEVNFVSLTRGKLWQSIYNDGRVGMAWFEWRDNREWNPEIKLMEWPSGPTETTKHRYANSKGSGVVLSALNVQDLSGATIPLMNVECGAVNKPSFNDIFPVSDPVLISNYGLSNPNIPAEEMAVVLWATKMGLTISRKSMVWGYDNRHGDYILHKLTFVNTGDMTGDGSTNVAQTLNDLYIGIVHGFQVSQIGKEFLKQEWGKADRDNEGVYDTERKVFYACDGSTIKLAFDDTGDPDPDKGVLYSATYAGFILLDSPDFENEPIVYNWWERYNNTFAISKMGDEKFRRSISAKTTPTYPPTMHGEPLCVMGLGPYTLPHGDSLSFVYAEACGSISMAERFAGNKELMPTGKDSLYMTFDAVIFNYTHNFNIPDAPKMPLKIEAEATTAGTIKLTWDNEAESTVDPDYAGAEANDFDGYRLYRSEYSGMGPWIKFREWKLSNGDQLVHELEDSDVLLGTGYFYGIASIDKGHDGWPFYLPEDTGGPVPPLESKKAVTETAVYKIRRLGKTLDEIKVVPNPFKIRSGLATVGDDLRIEFINLPPVCTIRIYTLYGDLVQIIEHTDGTGGESWGGNFNEYQVSKYTQRIAPGIYVYHVDSDVGQSVGKFVIIK